MKNIRIIPRLDIKGSNVVKPVHTEALRVVGDPKVLAGKYYEEGADEIIYLDIVASLYQRNLDFDLLKRVTDKIFIPFTVGGGIRSIQDINNSLRAGADKVAINTYVIKNPDFLREASNEFGSQCIVLSIEAKRLSSGTWEVFTDGGRERTGLDAVEWAKRGIDLGVGEILITSIDQDGTRRGYDLELIKRISSFSPIPIITYGGSGKPEHMLDAIAAGADALSAATMFHYNEFSIKSTKEFLKNNNIPVRII